MSQLPRWVPLGIVVAIGWTVTNGNCSTASCPAQTFATMIARTLGLTNTSVTIPDSSSAAQDTTPEKLFPKVKGHGGVYQLTAATQQPRENTKLCVDMTAGCDPGMLSPAIEKVARYVNIFAGAGGKPASVDIVVIMHGDATLKALDSVAFNGRFKIEGNPNLTLINDLREQGVRFYVCGQSLLTLGAQTDEVAEGIEVAVSALTANVNHQQDGFQVINLH